MSEFDNILDENSGGTDTGLVLTQQNKNDLLSISKWTKFLSIMGFIGIGFMVIGAFFVSAIPQRGFNNTPTGAITAIYLVMAVIYFFPIFYLFNFSSKIKEGVSGANQMSVNEGFSFLNKHYKYIGIFTIVIISIYVLIFLFAIAAAALQ